MAIQPPPLDSRNYDSLVSETESLAESFTATGSDAAWLPNALVIGGAADANLDPGSTMIRIFARMASGIVDRLNQVLEKNHLAFLDLLGAQQQPPLAARVPLTFHPVDGSTVEPVVPAGTQVAAPAAAPLAEAVFATDSELVLTRAQLRGVFVREPLRDYFTDGTAIASLAEPGAFAAFVGELPVERSLYFKCEALYALPNVDSVGVTFTFGTQTDAAGFLSLGLTWFYFSLDGWAPFSAAAVTSTAVTGSGASWSFTTTVALPAPSPLLPAVLNGVAASFLRASLASTPQPSPPITGLSSSAHLPVCVGKLDRAYLNGAPLDVTKDLSPFGAAPAFNDTLYLASADTFSKPGATVTLTVQLSDFQTLQPPGIATLPLVWEASSQNGWSPIAPIATTTLTGGAIASPADGSYAFLNSGKVTFKLPPDAAPGTVNGQTNSWVRVRIIAPPTTPATATGGAPSVKTFSLSYTGTLTRPMEAALSLNDLQFRAWDPTASLVAFTPPVNVQALYLGFDRAFANRAETLYLQIDPPSTDEVAVVEPPPPPAAPRVTWEYSAASGGWSALGVADETDGFTHSGLLRFIGPVDAAPLSDFGQNNFWLRARAGGTFAATPRLTAVLTNTVWATHALTTTNEPLGVSDGTAGQSFTTAHSPVLSGQRVEVDEPQPPTPDELQALVDVEGADAVAAIPAAPGQPARTWVRWHPVSDFHGSGATDRHYVIDYASGRVQFGDGRSGRIPPAGRQVRAALYQSGGGAGGNRDTGAIAQLKIPIAFVDSVTNREPASGGSDAETLEHLKDRTATAIRHGGRAVAAQDFEDLAFAASPSVARAHAVPPTFNPLDSAVPIEGAGRVLLLIVPESADAKPAPTLELIAEVQNYLDARRAHAVELVVAGPRWSEITVTVTLVPQVITDEEQVRAAVLAAIDGFLHPLTGGRDGTGWEFGRAPHVSDFYSLIAGVSGVSHIPSLTVAAGAPFDQAIPDARTASTYLIFSGTHQITVTE